MKKHQAVFSLDFETWHDLVEVYDITKVSVTFTEQGLKCSGESPSGPVELDLGLYAPIDTEVSFGSVSFTPSPGQQMDGRQRSRHPPHQEGVR